LFAEDSTKTAFLLYPVSSCFVQNVRLTFSVLSHSTWK